MVEIYQSWILTAILAVLVVVLLVDRQYMSSRDPVKVLSGESKAPLENTNKEDSATSGHLFMGNHLKYQGPLLFDGAKNVNEFHPSIKIDTGAQFCLKWGVVTTIFAPTEAIYKVARLHGWCLVVVGDRKSPFPYFNNTTTHFNHTVYLDVLAQEELSEHLKIISHLPWNHFGRKNVGYLYAVMHGAREIFDFDDDNELIVDNIHPSGLHLSTEKNLSCRTTNAQYSSPFINPYPFMGAVHGDVTWPRGYPLERIKFNYSSTTHPIELIDVLIPYENISIIQVTDLLLTYT
jgi:hypothetical protein